MCIEFDSSTGDIVLKINGESLCHYSSIDDAAKDVYSHETGYYDWDKLGNSVSAPKNITQWEKVPVKTFYAPQFQAKYDDLG